MLNAVVAKIASLIGIVATTVYSTPIRVDDRGVGSERLGANKRVVLNIQRVNANKDVLTSTIRVLGANLPNPRTGVPLGNAYASSTTPTSAEIVGDGTSTTFQTTIPYAAFSGYNWIVEVPSFKLTGTFTITAAGVITGSGSALDTETKVGDTVIIGGQAGTITAVSSATAATWDTRVAVAALAVGYNTARDRRIKTYNASVGTNPEYFTVTDVGGYALITFGVAPPKANYAPSAGIVTPAGAGNTDYAAVYFVTPVELLADGVNAFVMAGIVSKTVLWTQVGTAQIAGDTTLVTIGHGAE
jgi:hypothetical protein